LISDEEREAIAKRQETALADRSRVLRFRPIPAWLTRDNQPLLIRQGEKLHLRFGERHNLGMEKQTSYGVALPVNNSSVDLPGPVLSSSPSLPASLSPSSTSLGHDNVSSSSSSPASLSPSSTSLGHDNVPSSDEVSLLSILSSGITVV
jgi:hypothetical protein